MDRDHAGGPPPVHGTDGPDRPRADRAVAAEVAAGLGLAPKPAGRPWLAAAARGRRRRRPAAREAAVAVESDGARFEAAAWH
uniref:Uncharacterized protein n=1 Tax=Oryza sativa subsp. japonica TaxID=39947 RepID=Q6ERN1_ORYSJ|nr:hypothetical protein [Oryza sativa Japonica Group]